MVSIIEDLYFSYKATLYLVRNPVTHSQLKTHLAKLWLVFEICAPSFEVMKKLGQKFSNKRKTERSFDTIQVPVTSQIGNKVLSCEFDSAWNNTALFYKGLLEPDNSFFTQLNPNPKNPGYKL